MRWCPARPARAAKRLVSANGPSNCMHCSCSEFRLQWRCTIAASMSASYTHQLVVNGGAQLQVPQLGVAGGARPQVQLAVVQHVGAAPQRHRWRVARLKLPVSDQAVIKEDVKAPWQDHYDCCTPFY